MLLDKIRKFFSLKIDHEHINELVSLEAKRYLEAYITDVNCLKTDYLKRYLEVRMDSNVNLMKSLSSRVDLLASTINETQNLLEDLKENP